MKRAASLLLSVALLSGCALTRVDEDPAAYASSLAQAKEILKSNSALEKYETYYNKRDHKAMAQSKTRSAGSYAANRTSQAQAIEDALAMCNDRLKVVTELVACEIINVDNEWVTH